MKKGWKIPYSRPEVSEDLLQAGYGPLLAAFLIAAWRIQRRRRRGAFWRAGRSCLHDPLLMRGMAWPSPHPAGDRDGERRSPSTATMTWTASPPPASLTDYLRFKGLDCIPYIPDRNEEGYGLNRAALESLREQGVTLLITVDCGITAVEESDCARELGIDVIITDHHECKEGELPDAVAVIDCKQRDDRYPNPIWPASAWR